MAATYGRLTGKAGVCLATLGPGATNLVTPAAYAQLGAFPMLMITGQKPIKKSKQGQFQIVNIVDMMRPLTKSTRQVVNVNMIPSMVREAFRLAQEERPGAVHLELPEDIAIEPVDEKTTPVFEISKRRRGDADRGIIDDAVDMIRGAKHPLLLIGAGANRQRIWKALSYFLDQTGIPFFETQMGKGVVSGKHPLFMGTAALSDTDYVHCAIHRADLVINVGHDVVEKPPFFMEHGGPRVIHINFKSATVDNVYFPQLEVVGDIATSVTRIADLGREDRIPRSELLHDRQRRVTGAHPPGRKRHEFSHETPAPGLGRAPGHAGRRNHRVGQRRVQNLVCSKLPGHCAQHGLARQRIGYDGRRPAVGDGGGPPVSGSLRDGHLRRWRLHDEQPGDGNGGAPGAESRRSRTAR